MAIQPVFSPQKRALGAKARFLKRDDEKPTSEAITIGVPAVIVGVVLLCAAITLGVLYYRRYKKDKQENIEDAQWTEREHWTTESDPRLDYSTYNSRFSSCPGTPKPIPWFKDSNSPYGISTLKSWEDKPGQRISGIRVLIGKGGHVPCVTAKGKSEQSWAFNEGIKYSEWKEEENLSSRVVFDISH